MEGLTYIYEQLSSFPPTLIKLMVAFVLGGLLGLEREAKGKPVGFTTCVIISVASCLLTIVSIQSAEYYAGISDNIRSDPMRLAAQIISGIGFLGAGVIMHRSDDAISGLTTAAIVWASAGIGIASGNGFYIHAIAVTVLFFVAIWISPQVLLYQAKSKKLGKLNIRMLFNDEDGLQLMIDYLKSNKNIIDSLNIRDLKKERVEVNLRVNVRQKMTLTEFYIALKQLPHVQAVTLEH
ncbi:MgtC/SapB family protein [Providencia huaxiensis]|uniref:Protein MgtC n=1 Tax=Providencia huaxiensis TaxID=2027290 RepID=A0ABU2J1Q6_9GAMM|nr:MULTISPECIES: MgtC/SapB family protein [Providencia]MBZ3681765.1 MgtC/SapB family protein [Providencia rettgeri]MBN6360288.1 MgtC/SapB family protein [Providencia huaxiensis]MDT0135259.1 MgtC/SapB family protein [Providencia huaxiensis]MDT1981664.1 MgtC/SapB family protein [Providencia huaxiensis]QLR00928.1 MgtC/SapB family protein [Providencia rettgeri]